MGNTKILGLILIAFIVAACSPIKMKGNEYCAKKAAGNATAEDFQYIKGMAPFFWDEVFKRAAADDARYYNQLRASGIMLQEAGNIMRQAQPAQSAAPVNCRSTVSSTGAIVTNCY